MKDNKNCSVCDFVDAINTISDYIGYDDSDVTEQEFKDAKDQFIQSFTRLFILVLDELRKKDEKKQV